MAHDEAQNLAAVGTYCDSYSYFSCTLPCPVGDHSVDSDKGQEQGNAGEYCEQDGIDSGIRD